MFAEITSSSFAFLVALAGVSGLLLVRSNRYFPRSGRKPGSVPQPAPRLALQQATADYDRWQVQMHELARDLSGQIDSKFAALEVLVREAREASERLEVLIRQAAQHRAGATEPARRPLDALAPAYFAAGSPSADAFEACYFPQLDDPRSPAPATPDEPSPSREPRHAQVLALAETGLSAASIASRLGSQLGEVELILSLRGGGRS